MLKYAHLSKTGLELLTIWFPMLDHHKLSQDSKATGQDVISSQGYRGLWRGAFTHCTASILGGIARLSALKTTQMWVMPGGNRHLVALWYRSVAVAQNSRVRVTQVLVLVSIYQAAILGTIF